MSGPFKMKYKNSAFPFKSPLKQGTQHFDVTGDGVSAADIETTWEKAWRGHGTIGSVSDLLEKRKKRGWSRREEYVETHEKERLEKE